MPEIKHTFHAGRMNKDLDERLVPNGEYRDALNIQVKTTDDPDGTGGESGTVQNLKGNSLIGESYFDNWYNSGTEVNPQKARCVGSVADEKNDKGYFLFASPLHPPKWDEESDVDQRRVYVDTIIEQGLNGRTLPVVVDIFGVVDKLAGVLADGNDFNSDWSTIKTLDGSIYKPEMDVRIVDEYGTNIMSDTPLRIKAIDEDTILFHQTISNLNPIEMGGKWFIFESERVLNFSPGRFLVDPLAGNLSINNNYITGINIIDGMLFWTDNYSEPKKINIARCKAGTNINGVTNDYSRPSKLFVKDPISGSYVDANTTDFELDYGGSETSNGSGIDSYLREKHITVIKPAPRTPPSLIMKNNVREGTTALVTDHNFATVEGLTGSLEVGESYSINAASLYNTNFNKDDVLELTSTYETDDDEGNPITTHTAITAKFVSYQTQQGENLIDTLSTTSIIKIVILNGGNVNELNNSWLITTRLKEKPLFETTFGRFSYRYKYTDGEYSTFAPWSEIAFLPGEFSYRTDDGYNLGMVNTIRELTIVDFIPYRKPLDVIAVDILYKSTDSPNVYVVETIEKGRSSEWTKFTPDGTVYTNKILTGSLKITSEMLHRTLPSDQILRSWDNVPRYAKAQEVVGSRLLYGNYTQGYNMNDVNVDLIQDIKSARITDLMPEKSLKSMRDYKIGMVFGDKYGRETPVITSSYTVSDNTEEGYTSMTGDIIVPKSLSGNQNSFVVTQAWGDPNYETIPPTIKDGGWIDYVKYYIKETSNEYHNLVMDRWYHSGDTRGESGFNNIWVSFNSADRNKVDDETYLILKNQNGSDNPVFKGARYKILAIENEAPEYIKTKHNSIGIIGGLNTSNTFTSVWPSYTNEAGDAANASNTKASQLYTKTHVEIHHQTWTNSGLGYMGDDSYLSNNIFGKEIKGKIELRFVGACIDGDGVVTGRHESSWKEVVHSSAGKEEDSNTVIIRWKDPFKQEEIDFHAMVTELQMTSTEGYTLATLEYYIEFRESIVENKPEFDGKFFVKIKQDQFTNDSIEYITTQFSNEYTQVSLDWSVASQANLYYIRSKYATGANIPTQLGALQEQEGFYEFDWSLDQPPCHSYNCLEAGGEDPEPYFFGAFDEFLTPTPITTTAQSQHFDIASESTIGPDGMDAADPTDTDCDCIYYGEEVTSDSSWLGMGTAFVASYEYRDLSPFGSCSNNYATMTRNYWKAFRDYSNSGGDWSGIFLDECQMAEMAIIPGPDRELLGRTTGTEPGDLPEFGGPNNYEQVSDGWGYQFSGPENGVFARPVNAFSVGEGIVNGVTGASDGTYGSMVVSFTSSYHTRGVGMQPTVFGELQNPGTVFTFDSDTSNGTKFQVVGIMYQSINNDYAPDIQMNFKGNETGGEIEFDLNYNTNYNRCYSTPYVINNNNMPETPNSDTDCRFRHTIWVEFRRLDDTGSLTTLGLDPDEDPRWRYRHDGTGSCVIRILDAEVSYQDVTEMDVLVQGVESVTNKNGAVFETEPKKDPGLDIYYEASAALPMILNKDNIFDFAPINSKVAAVRTVKGNENRVLVTDRRTNRRVNNAHFLHGYTEHAIVSIISDDVSLTPQTDEDGNTVFVESATYGQSYLHRRDFTIGDKIRFKHPDGTVTQAEIKQLYKPVIPEESFTTIVDDDLQYGLVSGPKAFEPAGITNVQTITIDMTTDIISDSSFSVAKTALASNDPAGELEIGDVVKSIEYTNDLGVATSVTFGQGLDSAAPRGIQILGFSTLSDTHKIIKLSELPSTHTWEEVFSDILNDDSGSQNINVVFQKNYGYYGLDVNVWRQPVQLGWHNCWSFGNGLESDRIRDDFNAPMLDNGVKASTTFSGYKRETISSGLIYSGLYNSKSQVNNLNQFNMADKITKDLNPVYGSIQALKTRDTDVVVFTEDKTLKILANKDALYNADGNPQLTASDRVLGTAIPYAGDFGISKDPQSLAWDQYRMYFTDRQRGAVLRLSQDGLTPISEAGMSNWFRNELKKSKSVYGSFDVVSGEYNLTITPPEYVSLNSKTLSFSEGNKGWVSFKSFQPDSAVSYSGQYITVKDSKIWQHHRTKSLSGQKVDRNSFYGKDSVGSTVQVVFNESPSTIKSFKTMNYEGSQAKVEKYTGSTESTYTGVYWQESDGVLYPWMPKTEDLAVTDNEYYNLSAKNGWWVPGMYTDSQEGQVKEFKNKEGKWFSKISGMESAPHNLDSNEFTIQGVGLTDAYEYTGEVISDCLSGCLNADYECVDCDDILNNDQCTNLAGDVIDCNSPFCVAGPCITGPIAVFGCTNPNAINYNPDATVDDGSCVTNHFGCTDPENPNYDPTATESDSTQCVEGVVTGCMDPNALNYNPAATQDGVFFDEFNSYTQQTISMFTICYNDCSCLYSIEGSSSSDCDCISVMCSSCCTIDQTWNPDLEHCVDNDWDQVCADEHNNIISCSSGNCVSGPCVGSMPSGGGESGCLEGGPDCCTANQLWSEFDNKCVDIVRGCTDDEAINYMGPNLQYQLPNNSSTGYPNINNVTYDGTHPDTGVTDSSYAAANLPCYEIHVINGVAETALNNCCEYHAVNHTTGCMDPAACNHQPTVDLPCDDCCDYSCIGCMDATADIFCDECTIHDQDMCTYDNGPEGCSGESCWGCTDSDAVNYNELATIDDGSCTYCGPGTDILCDGDCPDGQVFNAVTEACENINPSGCPDGYAYSIQLNECVPIGGGDNVDSELQCGDVGYTCFELSEHWTDANSCYGCMDDGGPAYIDENGNPGTFQDPVHPGEPASNYNPCATINAVSSVDDTSPCTYNIVLGCTVEGSLNYNPMANTDDGSCVAPIEGCLDSAMFNYNPEANTDDGSCIPYVYGCMNSEMMNYNPFANTDEGTCVAFQYGCMDPLASNYDANATHDQKYTWCGDDNWDGTSAGIATNWIIQECSTCECEYSDETYHLDVINNPDDSNASTTANSLPWLLDPNTTDAYEDLFESPFEDDDNYPDGTQGL